MRKFFLFFASMLTALAVNAATVNIEPGSNTLISALGSAADGDVIVLADGVYNESSDYIVINKAVEIKAADGAKPVVEVETYIKIDGTKDIKIQGVKFDAAKQGAEGTIETAYSYFIRNYGAGTIELDGCEFCNSQANPVIYADKTHIDFLKINNCYFHDGSNAAIRIISGSSAHTCPKVAITNSTFANYGGFNNGLINIQSKGGATAATIEEDVEVVMDHCTFYNISKTDASSTYGVLDVRKSNNATVSNCIFADPATLPDGALAFHRATQLYGGTVSNCLLFNTPNHRTESITINNPLSGDPLFVKAAEGNYTLGEGSPALGAGTDASNLGDPRWWPVVEPTFTDFEINFMTIPYTATLPDGVSVEGTFHDGQHGYNYPKVTIPVLAGNYKITIGNCQHSNDNGTSIKNADESATLNMIDANGQTITSFLAKANCYHQTPAENITCAWFVADADQTIKVICPQYTPYFKIEKVDEVPAAKTMYTVSFSAGEAQGVAPAAIQVEAGHAITIPVNSSLYKEGFTLFCWTDGNNYYATNTSYIPADDVELEPVFNTNSVELLTATEDVTVKWMFGESNGAPTLALQGSAGLLVAQATIGETKIDVKLDINAASGKFSNAGRGDKWAQVNSGTVFTFPTKENAVVTMEAYTNPADYTVSAGTSTVNDNNYYSYLQVVLPASPATAIDNADAELKATKRIENGQLFIELNGVRYNVIGAEVR